MRKVKIWYIAERWWVGLQSPESFVCIGTRGSFDEAVDLGRDVWYKWCA